MNIYIDENLPPHLARGFNILQKPENLKLNQNIEVISIADEFGRGCADEEWIKLAGQKDSCIITQDYKIRRIRHQKALCDKYNLGMIYLRPPSKNGFTYWQMIGILHKNWAEICKIVLSQKRPFAYEITSRTIKRL
jgi:gamma-glutamyltranspeptidase